MINCINHVYLDRLYLIRQLRTVTIVTTYIKLTYKEYRVSFNRVYWIYRIDGILYGFTKFNSSDTRERVISTKSQ